jgi:hypothetical protein
MTTATAQPDKLTLKKIRACWHHMIERCHNQNSSSFPYYGGRGITVCQEWRTDAKAFIDWALANGFKLGLTIDRRENNHGYSPDNCRFVTRAINQQNRRKPAGAVGQFIGVCPTKNKKRWQAFIQKAGRRCYVGTFDSERQAAAAYDAAALEIYGAEARVNIPQRRTA